MRKRARRGSRRREAEDLNVTAFMNLMVVLVPFLLVMAVFSRLAILQLNLPHDQASVDHHPPALALEVVVRSKRIDVQARDKGLLKRLDNTDKGYDLAGLSDYLRKVKAKYPDKTDVTILLEPNIAYEHVVDVMDTVRVVQQHQGDRLVNAELFPDISIGDAPVAAHGGTS